MFVAIGPASMETTVPLSVKSNSESFVPTGVTPSTTTRNSPGFSSTLAPETVSPDFAAV